MSTPKLVVAIICYEGYPDLVMSLNAVKATIPDGTPVVVNDNSDRTNHIKRYVQQQHPDVHYLGSGENLGCTAGRNRIYNYVREHWPYAPYLSIIDQDIEVLPGWHRDMLAVMEKYKDTGIVAWPIAYRYRSVHAGGLVTEVASMCNMHRVKALMGVEQKWGGPFDERFFMHRFDSLICQRKNQIGWRTRLVMKYYKKGVPWSKQPARILHHHPNSGVKRNPRWKVIFQRSKNLYAKLQRKEGWSNWAPKGVPVIAREDKG